MRLLPDAMTDLRFRLRVVGALAMIWPAAALAQSPPDCTRNPGQTRWFVRAGAPADGDGTNRRPAASLAAIERCAPAGATISVLAPADGAAPLDGGIRLKDRQKLLGPAPAAGGKPSARLTNTGGTGDAVTLAHGNEIAHLHIDNPTGAAIFGDNVNGAQLHDLLLTRQGTAAPGVVDASLCRVVKTAEAVDMSQSVLRGCSGAQEPIAKAAILLLADDAGGVAAVKYSILRVAIQDNPAHEQPQFLWRFGVMLAATGRISALVELQDSSVENVFRGVAIGPPTAATSPASITDLRLDSLGNDGIGLTTGFQCSGRDKTHNTNCAKLVPAPRERRAHRPEHRSAAVSRQPAAWRSEQRRGHGDRGLDQGRSTIEVHVQRSDITQAAAAGVYTLYASGAPSEGCVGFRLRESGSRGNFSRPCRVPAGRLHEHRTEPYLRQFQQEQDPHADGRNRAAGPGEMIAQGNYFGDIAPADGKGDALGECHVLAMGPGPTSAGALDSNARCELYDVPGQGKATGIDARYHLASDPRPPKK